MRFESIQEMFRQAADRFPAHAAVECGSRVTSFQDIEARSNRLAGVLLAGGAQPGQVAALLIEDAACLAVAILAALKARCVFAPFDVAVPDRRLAALLADVGPRWVLVEESAAGRLSRLGSQTDAVTVVSVDGGLGHEAEPDCRRVPLPPDPDDRSYVFFTSGSTGTPKGIVGRLRAIDHFVRWEIETFGIGEGTRVSQLTSPAFDAVLRDLFVPLCCGGTVCAPRSRDILVDPHRLAGWIDDAEIHVLHCVPSLLRLLLSQHLGAERFPALRSVLLAGEPLLPGDVARWSQTFGDRIELVNLYGPSETTMTKLCYRVRPGDGDLAAIPIGKPMPGAAALVIDEQGRPCSPGQVGEILIRTRFRAHGYWHRPDLTEQAFVPNPFGKNPADLVYRTGDLARVLEDGNFVFLGRADQQVKIRGVRIEPAEIETLLRRHPAVREVAVTAQPRNGEPVLCAYLVLAEPVEPGTWRELLAADLPDVMIPSRFVVLDQLPRTLSGKIDRQALPAPAERETRAAGDPSTDEPRTAIEKVVAEIFAEVLGLERVGIHDNFFERGGHSLLVIQVLARVQQAYEIELPLGSLFEEPTVAGLANMVENNRPAAGSGLELPPLVRRGEQTAPLSFSQQRLWFMDQLQPGSSFYNLSSAVTLDGLLATDALRQALAEIVRRHESLRTIFRVGRGGEPFQVVQPAVPPTLHLIDLSRRDAATRLTAARELIRAASSMPFDLARGPLLRCLLLRLAPERHALSCTLHHIVADGWSTLIFVRELISHYEQFRERRPPLLPELPLQYTDFALWQREWLQGEVLEGQLAYWRQKLAGAPAVTSLPVDRPRPRAQSFRGGRRGFTISPQLVEPLRGLARAEGCTLFMTFLAAFQTLLHQLSGEPDVVVASPIIYRDWPEIQPLIGFFVNTLIFRTDFSGDPRFLDLLARVHKTCLEAFAHQHTPFEKLVEDLQPERSLSYNPLFQVGFTFNSLQEDEYARNPETVIAELAVKPLEIGAETTPFDLNLILGDSGQEINGLLQYSRDLFEDITIEWFQEQLLAIVARAASDPEVRMSELRAPLAEIRRRQWRRAEETVEQASREGLKKRRRKAQRSVV
jgi:amino acid adenylation domain-containing protein